MFIYDIVGDIYGDKMIAEWQGRQLVPTQSAYYEMIDLRFDLYDVLDILERGYACERSKRAKGIVEKCIRRLEWTNAMFAARQ